jgi:hypothetical protein
LKAGLKGLASIPAKAQSTLSIARDISKKTGCPRVKIEEKDEAENI